MKAKHIILIFLVSWFAISSFANIIEGDVNGDGKVTVTDLVSVIGLLPKHGDDGLYEEPADLNHDNIVDLCDVQLLAHQILTASYDAGRQVTLAIDFDEDAVYVDNPDPAKIEVLCSEANGDVSVCVQDLPDLIITLSGNSSDGRLRLESDAACTLRLDNLSLFSSHAPAINIVSDKKVKVELAEGSVNVLKDAKQYAFSDATEEANGCLNSFGQLEFSGLGKLTVTGNSKHAICSKKSISFTSGSVEVVKAKTDAIHSSKSVYVNGGNLDLKGMSGDGIDTDNDFIMTGGCIGMTVPGEAAKGIKCSRLMEISAGEIKADVIGALKNKNGDLSYCTALKCDSCVHISGGTFCLTNSSPGGKCISADKIFRIDGGSFDMSMSGDGGEYVNAVGELDYYTSKCIAVDDSLFITRGEIHCCNSALGGKGIVAGHFMQVGQATDTDYEQGPKIIVETTDKCIIDNIDEDLRFGCPKAIKVNEYLNIYSGDIHVSTAGMGGEGIECNKEFYFYGGNLECNCYDDGINVGEKLVVLGGQIYANSLDNDGIDSNGSMYLQGGIVASVNQLYPDESLDTEQQQLYLQGATVFGIGSSMVKLNEQEECFYNTITPPSGGVGGLRLTNGKYLYVIKGEKLLMAMQNDCIAFRQFVTIALPELEEGDALIIAEGDRPTDAEVSLFDGKLMQNCNLGAYSRIATVTVRKIND